MNGISIAVIIHSIDCYYEPPVPGSKSKWYSRFKTRNELRYYEPSDAQ